jgi:mannose-6-phosphate isomerase-like protein (cupin superfamily)
VTVTQSQTQNPPVANATRRQIASDPTTSRAWWFLGTLAVLRNPEGAPRSPAVIELTVPPGSSPPLHVHDTLDDSFLMIEGEVAVRCGTDTVLARPGSYVALPAGVEHTFRVTSSGPARMLLVHADDSFLRSIEALGAPAAELSLPPAGEAGPDVETLVRVMGEHHVRIVGPPMSDDEARHASARPDTTDMMAVHGVFRQAFAAAPALVGGAAAGEPGRVELVASYYDNVLRFLLVHHNAEDSLVWPKLTERCPAESDLVQRMISHHDQVHAAQEQAAAAVSEWSASAGPETAARLTGALAELSGVLLPHLDDEEDRIVPLCAEHLSVEEWGQMPGHALAHYDGDKIWLILGLIRQNMTPAQRDAMLEHMPPPARDMWVNMGNAAFDGFMAQLAMP